MTADDVHVWTLRTSVFSEAETDANELLSEEERKRASSFRFERDRNTYTATRAALRIALGHYLDEKPAILRLKVNAYGKPSLECLEGKSVPFFNVSHAAGYAAIAVAGSEVGIDIEHTRTDIDVREIARMYFSKRESDWLEHRSSESQRRDFFRLWVIKEAFVKCVGLGLSIPLKECEVDMDSISDRPPDSSASHYTPQSRETHASHESPEPGGSPPSHYPPKLGGSLVRNVSSANQRGGSPLRIRWKGHDDRRFGIEELHLWNGFTAALALEQTTPSAVHGRRHEAHDKYADPGRKVVAKSSE